MFWNTTQRDMNKYLHTNSIWPLFSIILNKKKMRTKNFNVQKFKFFIALILRCNSHFLLFYRSITTANAPVKMENKIVKRISIEGNIAAGKTLKRSLKLTSTKESLHF
jgi:hypothetical protein